MHSTQSRYKPRSRGSRWARKCSGRGLLALSMAEGSQALLVFVMGLSLLACSVTAQTPSPALLILEKSDSMLAIADPATLKIVARVPSGPDPHEVIAAPDGKFAYV